MAKLIINPQMPSRKEIDLPRADLSIGRDPTNDVVIADALVSRRHALIVFDGREYLFHDCQSSNGSLLNGARVSERRLADGDVLWLGASRLLFRAPESAVEGNLAKVIQHPSSRRMRCPACDHAFQAGDVFCRNCGATLEAEQAVSFCASCNARVVGPARFCNACGDSLAPPSSRSLSYQRRLDRADRADTSAIDPSLPAASVEKRLLAALVDLLAAASLMALLSLPPLGLYLNFDKSSPLAIYLMILPLLSFPMYFVGFWATRSATPGKELMGLLIVRKDGAKRIGIREALVRFVGFCISLVTLGLGFMMILVDGETLHDRLAETRVVERSL
ncbi:MAG: RDD family protein [Vicinamibacteria bacterium]|nr:RDD family protein [Vicinamibacteria bacterium]